VVVQWLPLSIGDHAALRTMKLYEILFLDRRDPDGDRDAIFLVRARDLNEAVSLAKSARRHNESFKPHIAFEIGTESSIREHQEPKVLRGPYYECGFNFGWREWRRKGEPYDTDNEADIWEEVKHS
jgi:hypothetical protein